MIKNMYYAQFVIEMGNVNCKSHALQINVYSIIFYENWIRGQIYHEHIYGTVPL